MVRIQLNIKMEEETKARLDKFGSKGNTYEDILNKLMDISEKIKKLKKHL